MAQPLSGISLLTSPSQLKSVRIAHEGKEIAVPRRALVFCSARTVPAQCPYGAHTVPIRCPLYFSNVFAHRALATRGLYGFNKKLLVLAGHVR